MRILQVVHDFLPNATGGTEIYTYSLSKALSKHHDVHLFFKDMEIDKSFKKGNFDGLPFVAVNPRKCSKSNSYFNLIKSKIYFSENNKKIDEIFKDMIKEFKPEIIHFQHLICLSMNLVDIAYKAKIPIVFTAHDYWLLCPKAHFIDDNNVLCTDRKNKYKCVKCLSNVKLYRFEKVKIFQSNTYIELAKNLIKIALNPFKKICTIYYIFYLRPKMIQDIIKKVNIFVAPSKILKSKFVENGLPTKKVVYVDSGIDNSNLKNIQKTKSKQIRFAFIGSVSIHKGIKILIESFDTIKDAVLEIYGFTSEESKKKYMNLAKNKNVHFMGSFKHDEIGKIFSKIDILIMPSICMENSPLTIREAFASKTPVIASDIGGLSEMIQDSETGLLFKAGDSRDLFKKIRYFINNPVEVKKMSKGIKKVKTIEENSNEMEIIYKDLILKNSSK